MELEQLKQQIDDIDGQVSHLFAQRMAVSGQIAKMRAEKGLLPDAAGMREAKAKFQAQVGRELEDYAGVLYGTLQDVSQSYQATLLKGESPLCERIKKGLENTQPLFPEKATVACQGVEGAFAQIAVQRLFREPSISYVNRFEAVFSAIANGFCRYGVLPLENSTAGSVNKIYDLMMEYNFSIVRSVRLKVSHNLVALPGVKLEDVKEVFSHEQAIAQCSDFLKNHPTIRVTVCENTAVAAKMVAESSRRDIAALASYECGELYGLQYLAEAVQDKGNNYTRFICIGKDLEIFPGADRTSIMLTISHKPGSLYKIMARINALGINMTKLESRPLPDRDFEFMFYFDLDTSVYSPRFIQLMGDMENLCETFRYLGSYTEVV